MDNDPLNQSIFQRFDESSDNSFGTAERNRENTSASRALNETPDLAVSDLQVIGGDSLATVSMTARSASQTALGATQVSSLSAASLATSIADAETLALEWGIGEGVGTGTLPDVFGSCGCGSCSTCNGGSGGGGGGTSSFGNPNASTLVANLDQVVFLDFDSGTDGSIDYTQPIRNQVQAQMATIFQNFGVTFVQEIPEEGDFTTLVFNAGSPGGLAEDIDFRNLNKNDNGVINIEGFGLTNTPFQIINASANIGAHELGHLLGLRHHDAFGTIGAGIPDGLFFPGFSPVFPGPSDANETRSHVLNTPALAGDVTDVLGQVFLGEREAIKLAFAAGGSVLVESTANNDTFQQAQAIEFGELAVPNTILDGENAGAGDFIVDAVSVVGSFTFVDAVDYYSFEGRTGLAYSFEAISNVTNRFFDVDPVDPIITIFDSNFEIVQHFDGLATNDDDVEFSFDSHLFDLFLPEDGTYFIEVDTFSNGDAGNYELFVQGFVTSPFNLPDFDDHTDFLSLNESTQLLFEPVSDIVIARSEGIIGFAGSPAERDIFGFTIDSSARAIINVSAASDFFDAFVEVFDSAGNLVGSNDNNTNPSLENSLDSQLIIPSLTAGDYFVSVSGANGSTGAYRLGVRHNGTSGSPDDHGDSFPSATTFGLQPLPNTTFINASAEIGTDVDVFRFTALSTGRLVVRTKALSGDLNTVLRAFDEDINLLDANNNFNGSLDSRVSIDTVAGTSYFVRLNSVGDSAGDYRLSFRSIPDNNSGGFNPNGLSLGNDGSDVVNFSYDKNVSLNYLAQDSGVAFEEFLASSDLSFGRVDDYDSVDGILTGNV